MEVGIGICACESGGAEVVEGCVVCVGGDGGGGGGGPDDGLGGEVAVAERRDLSGAPPGESGTSSLFSSLFSFFSSSTEDKPNFFLLFLADEETEAKFLEDVGRCGFVHELFPVSVFFQNFLLCVSEYFSIQIEESVLVPVPGLSSLSSLGNFVLLFLFHFCSILVVVLEFCCSGSSVGMREFFMIATTTQEEKVRITSNEVLGE